MYYSVYTVYRSLQDMDVYLIYVYAYYPFVDHAGENRDIYIYTFHQKFQIPKMEVLNPMRLWGEFSLT